MKARAASSDHHRMLRGHSGPQRRTHFVTVGHDQRLGHLKPEIAQAVEDDQPGGVRINPGRCARRDRDHLRRLGHSSLSPSGRLQSPLRPPDLANTRTSVITAARSIALIMSITARPATDTAVSASISTPLGTEPSRSAATHWGLTSTRAAAVAVRTVTSLALTSTIRASPVELRCGNRDSVTTTRRAARRRGPAPPPPPPSPQAG